VPILEALLARPDPVVAVVCQPDRPRGRGLAVAAPEVKQLARTRGLTVLQPERLRDPAFHDALRALQPDLIAVAAYGKILPRSILDLPPHGCLNVHASLLPRHRGAAPVPWAILAGDATSGVTIMAMTEEMDAGDILLQRQTAIRADETGGTLSERLAHLGAQAIGEAIEGLKAGALHPSPQPSTGITFAPRITHDHCRMDWSRSATELGRVVRAFAPAPAAFTTLQGRLLKVHHAVVNGPGAGAPGQVVRAGPGGIVVATGEGNLRLLEVQLAGRRRLSADVFMVGHPIPPGTCLGAP
jgi:methionyl-tRNA formyltransferase